MRSPRGPEDAFCLIGGAVGAEGAEEAGSDEEAEVDAVAAVMVVVNGDGFGGRAGFAAGSGREREVVRGRVASEFAVVVVAVAVAAVVEDVEVEGRGG